MFQFWIIAFEGEFAKNELPNRRVNKVNDAIYEPASERNYMFFR
jgi:hypothetical protein